LPIGYKICTEHGLVISTGCGRLTSAELMACMEQGLSDPSFHPSFNQIVDFREVTSIDMSGGETRTLANVSLFSSVSKRAVVAPSPANFGVGRMFATYHEMSESRSQVRIFHDLASALAWLAIESTCELLQALISSPASD